jgi:hypothetical protein
VRVRPVAPALLAEQFADWIAGWSGFAGPGPRWLRVGFDGAPAARPGALADAVTNPLLVRGKHATRVDLSDFPRPASVRLEFGRTNPDSFYERWYDLPTLSREVLDPLAPGGTGRILTSFWNPTTDRATRSSYVDIPPGSVLLLSGPLLLGAGLDLDLTVHCVQSPAALARRTPESEQWTLPAYERYAAEVSPESLADRVLRMDDPDHPALVIE